MSTAYAPRAASINVTVRGAADLATDAYPPPRDGPATVIVTRTAYGKARHVAEAASWTKRGYGYVVQDVRGRFDSSGTWEPYRHERADGAALLDWLRGQPWVGRIVVLGGSYNAYCAWSAAAARPDLVHAVVSLAPALGFGSVKFDPSGVLRLEEHVHWWVDRAEGRVDRPGLAAVMVASEPDLLHHMPVVGIADRLWPRSPSWRAVVEDGPGPGPEPLVDDDLRRLGAHTLHVCGVDDLVAADAIDLWQRSAASGDGTRTHTMVLGPWDHDLTLAGADGRQARPFDLGTTIVRWLRDVDRLPPSVSIRVLPVDGEDWEEAATWPPADVVDERWSTANPSMLTRRVPPDGSTSFADDPSGPVPSIVVGRDRRSLETSRSIARFTSDPLPRAVTIMGDPVVRLSAAADTPTSDWIVRLAVVHVDGTVTELASGTYVADATDVRDARVRLSPCAAWVGPGRRLRLEVAGSDFPRLARNPNTGENRYTARDVRISTRVVTCGHSGTAMYLPMRWST